VIGIKVVRLKRNVRMITWKKEDAQEVRSAKKKFEEYVRRGWLAYIVDSENKRIQVTALDPEFERIFLIALSQGG
jgi:hypothetical protein